MARTNVNAYMDGRPRPTGIVQEWGAEQQPACGEEIMSEHFLPDEWRKLNRAEQQATVEAEAEMNGIERPKGYDVSFHFNSKAEQHHFGQSHPMKPWRLTLTKQLVLSYGLQYAMDIFETLPATMDQLNAFHSREYLEYLSRITPDQVDVIQQNFNTFFLGPEGDCPVFDGMWDYCRLYSGASIDAARNLISNQSDIAINWSGGLHHAMKSHASGFCYINDIVLAIQQLLTVVSRVLYIDIDIHHGDGVQTAFWSTDRVMTLSYHKFDPLTFFPGTGAIDEAGPKNLNNPGAHYSLNVPLHDGIDDRQYEDLFDYCTGECIRRYDPQAIVLQCGADSLGGDRLGKFNLNIRAHGHCVDFVKRMSHNRRLMIIGGGGYTPRNVARAWCHETALSVGATLRDALPAHVPYRQAFMGEENGSGLLYPRLDNIPGKQHPNTGHTREYLQKLKENIDRQLRYVDANPSVTMQEVPNEYVKIREEEDARIRDELEEKEGDGSIRKRREKNVGGRLEPRAF